MKQANQNLFAALRAGFPPARRLRYTWRDLDRATAMMANLLASLDLPASARIAVQVEKSVEALMLYLATLRAGYVFLPLNTAYQSAEIEYFIGNAEPAVVVCSPKTLAGSARSLSRRARACVHAGGRPHRQPAGACRPLQRPAHAGGRADDLAAILYTSGTTGRSKGAMLSHGNMLSNALVLKDYWGWRKARAMC
jgi:malonyl-CoA/methylmalonyl-CoA synthetase